jgi:hypothetical protein
VDTPAAATPVPAEATPQAPTVDWENRYKAAQAELTRQQMARAAAERERDALRMEQPEPDDPEAPVTARRAQRNSEAQVEWKKRAEAAEWQIAESVHGQAAMAAYRKYAELAASATTPSDVLTAHRVFAQELARAEAPQQPAPATPPTIVPSVVDSNRSDGPHLLEVEQKLREAAAAKDLRGWISAKLAGASQG